MALFLKQPQTYETGDYCRLNDIGAFRMFLRMSEIILFGNSMLLKTEIPRILTYPDWFVSFPWNKDDPDKKKKCKNNLIYFSLKSNKVRITQYDGLAEIPVCFNGFLSIFRVNT